MYQQNLHFSAVLCYSSIFCHSIEMTSFLKQVFRRIKFYDLPGIKDHHPEEWTRRKTSVTC